MSGDFYVTLPSAGSLDVYPNNTLSDYYNEFSVPIDLQGKEYLVGLVEILFEGTAGKVIDGEKLSALDTNEIYDTRQTQLKDSYRGTAVYIYSNICEPQYVGSKNL